jgi:hypothetical protein
MPAPEATGTPPDQVDAGNGPVEKVVRGKADETPLLALGGVTIAVGLLVAIVLAASFLVYYLA